MVYFLRPSSMHDQKRNPVNVKAPALFIPADLNPQISFARTAGYLSTLSASLPHKNASLGVIIKKAFRFFCG
jgi:hypothetical protein